MKKSAEEYLAVAELAASRAEECLPELQRSCLLRAQTYAALATARVAVEQARPVKIDTSEVQMSDQYSDFVECQKRFEERLRRECIGVWL